MRLHGPWQRKEVVVGFGWVLVAEEHPQRDNSVEWDVSVRNGDTRIPMGITHHRDPAAEMHRLTRLILDPVWQINTSGCADKLSPIVDAEARCYAKGVEDAAREIETAAREALSPATGRYALYLSGRVRSLLGDPASPGASRE